MKRKIVILGAIILIFILAIASINEEVFYTKDKTKEKTFLSIQKVIDQANEKDTIKIPETVFNENIYINKSINLIGENKEKSIIDGRKQNSVIFINSEGVTIKNLTIRNSGGKKEDTGIIINSDKNEISNCVFYRTRTAIKIDRSNENIISNCFFQDNGEGVFCNNSEGNVILKCQIMNSAFGINLEESKKDTIKNSYIHNNGIGIYARKSLETEIFDSAICDNNQDGGGIWAFDCKNLKIKNCNINHNGAGVKLEKTDVDISNCNLEYNMYNTLRLIDVEKTNISNCNIVESFRTAVYLENSYCEITNCNLYGNRLYGIESDKNSFYTAKNNYWGAKKGPSYTAFGNSDRVSFKPIKNKIDPWKTQEIKDIGSNWIVEKEFQKNELEIEKTKKIIFSEKDTDKDNVPDFWEEKWGYDPKKYDEHNTLDPDNDGLNNIEECYTEKYGSNPFYKDIFIEVDYSKENMPTKEYIDRAKEIFKEKEISLHIDTGELDGGEEIPYSSINSASDFRDIYWDYFLENDIDNPRKGIFHYAIVVDEIEEIYPGFVFVGLNNLDTIGLATKNSEKNYWYVDKGKLITGGIIHELGHSMGLLIDDHGGIDNLGSVKFFTKEGWMYKNYFSCLNYRYVYLLLGFSDGSHGRGDFDDYSNLDYSFFKDTEFNLNEDKKVV